MASWPWLAARMQVNQPCSNACMGTKVAITSPVAQTTRRRMRAVVNRPDFQLVFVDTPGIHKPKDGLGSELNRSALAELGDVDVVALLIDASAPIGRGDEWVASRVRTSRAVKVLVLTKADKVDQPRMMRRLKRRANSLILTMLLWSLQPRVSTWSRLSSWLPSTCPKDRGGIPRAWIPIPTTLRLRLSLCARRCCCVRARRCRTRWCGMRFV